MSILKFIPKNKKSFKSAWKTDNISAGSSNDNQVKLPLELSGVYNMIVDWGDGSKNIITAWNQLETTHTYASIGTYIINIYGTCKGFRFNNTGDRLKITDIKTWGNKFNLGNNNGYFYGCNNLLINAINILNQTITTMENMFRDCINFNQSVSNFNTVNATSMYAAFNGCTNFNQSVSNFNTVNVITMQAMFLGCTNFNQLISNFNTANVTNMSFMFNGCTNFNQSVSNFNTANATTLGGMFNGCTNFNQSVSNFNIEKVTTLVNMLNGATSWSTSNYDTALISWAAQNVKDGVTFRCSTKYSLGGAAEAARTHLTTVHSWAITDLGGI